MIDLVSAIALILALSGNILINFKKKIGYIIWIASNIAWIVVNVIGYFNTSMVLMYMAYVVLNAMGFVQWSKKE